MKAIKHDNQSAAASGRTTEGRPAGELGYERPRLTRLGSLAELTRGGGGTFQDASGLQDAGGSGSI